MNRLAQTESPYLQQHKNNPVDWYPWGEEAFAQAREENKPILVSIGYSSCHWCHVMERESFEDEETAALMNDLFINIKVDREEHPAVDNYYMSAVQMLSGSGGWPLNCFLTPTLKPYFGGTYYPPVDKHGRPSWKKVVQRMAFAYREKNEEVEEQATKLSRMIDQGKDRFVDPKVELKDKPDLKVEKLIYNLKKELDIEEGGLKNAPKFPSPHIYQFLLSYAVFERDEELKEFLTRTAHAFIDGGLFDPVHGGFARYCVDEKWRIPHFEKMLYDNAGILQFLSQMQAFLPDKRFAWAINKTLNFWETQMKNEKGLFLSAVDADSEGEEGKYYTWSYDELDEVLSPSEIEALETYAQISKEGNWEGSNILYTTPEKRKQFFEKYDGSTLEKILAKLKTSARDRVKPGLDDKVLLDWNAMMISAYFDVARYTGNQETGNKALNSLRSLLDVFLEDEKIAGHVHKNGNTYAEPVLDDYAFLIESLIHAYEWDFDVQHLELAKSLLESAINHFSSDDTALYIQSAKWNSSGIGQQPTYFDSPYPSANSVMANNLRKLGVIYDNDEWKDQAHRMLQSLAESTIKFPTSFANWAYVGLFSEELTGEIAIIGAEAILHAGQVRDALLPGHILMASENSVKKFPILDRKSKEDMTTFYLCQNYSCQKPVYTNEDFLTLKRTSFNY